MRTHDHIIRLASPLARQYDAEFTPTGLDLAFNPAELRDAHGRWSSTEWRATHRPPGRAAWESDPEHALAGRGDMVDTVFPDFYEHPEWYRTGDDKSDRESIAVLRRIKGNPDAQVAVYRGVPTEFADQPVRPGDWVTLSRSYAQGHVDSTLYGNGKVLKRMVKAHDIYSAGDSINEFGYDGDLDLSNAATEFEPALGGHTHLVTKPDDDTTVRRIAVVLIYSGDPQEQTRLIARMLAPFGISKEAVDIARGLAESGTNHRPNAKLADHGATTKGLVKDVRDADLYYRAAYLANAAQRIDRSLDAGKTQREALRAERVYFRAHEEARRGRLRSAAQVQAAQGLFGDTLGWYLNPMLKNDPECIAANGHNFDANEGTVVGLPGSVHRNCGCYAGPPHEGARLVNEIMGNVLPLRKSKPKFKLKGRK